MRICSGSRSAGGLNAGKSTLVNALLGQKLAATDATECTKLVSWFTFGLINQVVIQLRNGQAVTLPGAAAGDRGRQGRVSARRDRLIGVKSSNRTLAREYTLVDTPGLDALSGLDEMSLNALSQADVLLYVMPHPGENDREALTALRETADEAGINALSTIGVLSRIDQLGDGTGDPWLVARRLAGRYSRQLASLVAVVIPVAGLLAETALGDGFTEADMRPLRRLHRFAAADPPTMDAALYTAEDFRAHPALPILPDERERLLSLLGIYGIRAALAAMARGIQGAAALLEALRAASGIDVLLDQLKRQFVDLADPLRGRYALQALDAVTWRGTSPAEVAALTKLRDDLDAVRDHPKLRQFGLLNSLAELEAGRWQAPQDASAELAALATESISRLSSGSTRPRAARTYARS